jgi:hypothetical protein
MLPLPSAAFRGKVAAPWRKVADSWNASGRETDAWTFLIRTDSSAGHMRTARAKLTPVWIDHCRARLASQMVLGNLNLVWWTSNVCYWNGRG